MLIVRLTVAVILGAVFSMTLALLVGVVVTDFPLNHPKIVVMLKDEELSIGNLSSGEKFYFISTSQATNISYQSSPFPTSTIAAFNEAPTTVTPIRDISSQNYTSSTSGQAFYVSPQFIVANSSTFTVTVKLNGNSNVTIFVVPGAFTANYRLVNEGTINELIVTYHLRGNLGKGFLILPIEVNGKLTYVDVLLG
ncbi:hypothetical protein HS1genome_0691 [Sulfodiicoccus acidiphilus]|uniref:Uncharacterized protein n=1 Tax=Sulfodiicoccus acidiphilus TaxID=1670455 RepID=A0A348B2A0_9CREN|nr:hypothetical protein HS1genome_0691 [Sulfodiicoccus acidiphilus]